jgi:hypothetical protein
MMAGRRFPPPWTVDERAPASSLTTERASSSRAMRPNRLHGMRREGSQAARPRRRRSGHEPALSERTDANRTTPPPRGVTILLLAANLCSDPVVTLVDPLTRADSGM